MGALLRVEITYKSKGDGSLWAYLRPGPLKCSAPTEAPTHRSYNIKLPAETRAR